jgi:hypothetical protein
MRINQTLLASLTVLSVALPLSTFAQSGEADSYQFEAGISQARLEGDGVDINQTTVATRYHFSPISTATGPLAEAAFIHRSANIFAAYQHDNFNFKFSDHGGNQSYFELGGVYADKDSDLFLRGAVTDASGSGFTRYDLSAGGL